MILLGKSLIAERRSLGQTRVAERTKQVSRSNEAFKKLFFNKVSINKFVVDKSQIISSEISRQTVLGNKNILPKFSRVFLCFLKLFVKKKHVLVEFS